MEDEDIIFEAASFGKRAYDLILNSELLEPEDYTYVEQLLIEAVPSFDRICSAYSGNFSIFVLVPVVVCFAGLILSLAPITLFLLPYFTIVTVVIIGYYIVWFLLKYWSRRTLEQYLTKLNEFLSVNLEIDRNIKRLLNTIHEREVLCRGYAVYNKNLPPSDNPPQSFGHNLVLTNVRETLHNVLMKLFLELRQDTLLVLCNAIIEQDRPLCGYYDQSHHAFVELEKFAALSESRENITITTLKTCFDYFILQRSEFLRVLIVYHSIAATLIKNLASKSHVIKFDEVTRRIYALNEELKMLVKLNSYENTLKKAGNLKHPGTKVRVEYVHIRSLASHLQLALEKLCEKEEALFVSSYEDDGLVNEVLNSIESNLKSCLICIEELRSRKIDRVELVLLASYVKADGVQPIIGLPVLSDSGVIQEHDYSHYPVEDQVFEAIVPKVDYPEIGETDSFSDSFTSEKFSHERQNLLTELKSVLCIRHTIMHERELRALATSRGITLEDLRCELEQETRIKDDGVETMLQKSLASQSSIQNNESEKCSAVSRLENCRSIAADLSQFLAAKLNSKVDEVMYCDDSDDPIE